jgi:hypothetical protein
MKEISTCRGLNENGFRCHGKGYYDSKEFFPAYTSKKTTFQNHNLIKCAENQPPISKQKRYSTVWPWLEKAPAKIITRPSTPKKSNKPKLKIGLLAPVPNQYLERAVRDIYPVHGKVSFGSDKENEMRGIQQYVESTRNVNVNVYLFYQYYTRYKAILINEFYFDADPETHSKPWVSWNLPFKSYYTVIDIVKYEVPVTDFTYFNTKKQVEYPPHRPLWIFD